jgi:hypothetical protein
MKAYNILKLHNEEFRDLLRNLLMDYMKLREFLESVTLCVLIPVLIMVTTVTTTPVIMACTIVAVVTTIGSGASVAPHVSVALLLQIVRN